MADLDRAIQINPGDVYAYRYRARARAGLKDYKGAVADYNVGFALNPELIVGDPELKIDEWKKLSRG